MLKMENKLIKNGTIVSCVSPKHETDFFFFCASFLKGMVRIILSQSGWLFSCQSNSGENCRKLYFSLYANVSIMYAL